jgi:hypothetical protein
MADLTELAKEIIAAMEIDPEVEYSNRTWKALCRRVIELEAENAELRSSAPFDYLFAVRKIMDPEKPERMMLSQIAPAVAKLRETVDKLRTALAPFAKAWADASDASGLRLMAIAPPVGAYRRAYKVMQDIQNDEAAQAAKGDSRG